MQSYKLGIRMVFRTGSHNIIWIILISIFATTLILSQSKAQEIHAAKPGNFGLPGIIDLPSAQRFPDGEIVITQQIHKSLARSGISFQALP